MLDFFGCFFSLSIIPEGPARNLNASRQKVTPHCLAATFDSRLPSPKLPLQMPPKLPLPPQERAFFFFQNCRRGEGTCAAIERQKLSRGNPKGPFCTKNATALDSVVICYRRSFLLSVPFSCLFRRKTSFPEHSPYRFAIAVANLAPVLNLLSVVFLLREGPLGP